MLQRVLGGEHQERLRQPVGLVADRDLVLLHRLKGALCTLAGARLISSASSRFVNTGPLRTELARLRLIDQGADQIGGQQVRVNWIL